MGGVLALIAVLVFFGLLFGGFQFIMGKYFGVKIHGKFQARSAFREEEMIQQQLGFESPEDIEEGIKRCKTKHYATTASNILSEITELKKERTYKTYSVSKTKNVKEIISSLLQKKESNTLDKLERINKLKESGTITHDELIELKKKVLSNSISKGQMAEILKNGDEFIKNEAITILKMLYFDFKDEFPDLSYSGNDGLLEILTKTQLNNKYSYIYENYNKISQLYFDNIISKDEFHAKKRLILFNVINDRTT